MNSNIFLTAIAVVILSCNNMNNKSANETSTQDISLAPNQIASKSPGTEDAKSFSSDVATATDTTTMVLNGSGPSTPDWDKKIIKTAKLTLELKDYLSYNASIHARLKNFGAYIAQEQQSETDEQIKNTVTIKVPVDQFENLMNNLPGDDIKVIDKSISTEDVTGEVVDVKSRLEAKKQVRDKYLELLKHAKNMKEILQVQDEINTIQEDIESAEGRINYLQHASAYSTINLTYYQYINGVTSKDVEPNFLTELRSAFASGSAVITNLILFVISIWPLMVAGIFLFFYLRRMKFKKV